MAENLLQRESFFRICTNHAPDELLSLRWHKVGNVVDASLDFFKQRS